VKTLSENLKLALLERIERQLRSRLGSYRITRTYSELESEPKINISGPKNYGTNVNKNIYIRQYRSEIAIDLKWRRYMGRKYKPWNPEWGEDEEEEMCQTIHLILADPKSIDTLDKWIEDLIADIKRNR
jgi:hypothetical protein